MNKLTIKYLKKLLTHLEYYNNMAPFPPYDTDYVKEVEKTIKDMKKTLVISLIGLILMSGCKKKNFQNIIGHSMVLQEHLIKLHYKEDIKFIEKSVQDVTQ